MEKVVCQGCILLPCLFNFMQSTSCEILGWMNHKLESRLQGEISITSDMQMAGRGARGQTEPCCKEAGVEHTQGPW